MEVWPAPPHTPAHDMTDAVRSERAPRAGPGITVSFRELMTRAAMLARERAVFESAALLLPIVLVGLTHASGPGLWLAAAIYLAAGVLVAARMPADGRMLARVSRGLMLRMALSIAMVAAGQLFTGSTGLLSVVYLPIIAICAFAGPRLLMPAALAAVGAHLAVETIDRGSLLEAVQRALGFAAAVFLVAYGTRREVRRMEEARDRLRRAVRGDRRRSRQIAGVEAIGRILAERGPSIDALERVVARISNEFGHRYVSIYLGDERGVTLGAQRGYADLVQGFDGEKGIVGRVMRTRRPAFVPDVGADPDYWGINHDVTSEICVPLLAEGDFLGFVNVESTDGRPLDITDLRVMVAVADRLAAALIIGRDRDRLARRADLFHHLHEFSEAVNSTLQPDELYRAIVRSVSGVLPADVVTLHVLDQQSGRYLLRAVEGAELTPDAAARSGEGMAGRAIRDRTMIIEDGAAHSGLLADEGVTSLSASVPLIRDSAVLGAMTLMRSDRSRPLSDLERDALAMLAQQTALAITNVFLHAEVAELALRDPLTGLFNRRYLDPAMEQLFARRARRPVDERVPLAAIMFDLDHFSELNNLHGHQVGDEVLRVFGGVLRSRMRATDLVARFGGEEFVAILFSATLDDAIRIADEVRVQLAGTPILGSDGTLTATVSAGCAAVSPDHDAPEELLRAADVALYMAKRAGRDRVCAA